MEYSLYESELQNIQDIIDLNRKIQGTLKGKELRVFKNTLHKNLVIEIYTFWENFSKSIIYDCYFNYKKLLVDKRFLVNFFKNVNEKSYVRQLFLKNIEENKLNITIENLCYSNNLTFKELESLFKRVMFDVNDFYKHIDGFPELQETIKSLQDSSIEPVFEEVKSRYDTREYVEAYLDLLVNNRNSVAHQYKITEIYSLEQFQDIFNFIKIMVLVVVEFVTSQLLKKGLIKKEIVSNLLHPVKVIRSNSNNKSAILWVRNSSCKSINKNEKFYYYDRAKKIYRMANILTVLDKDKNDCDYMIPYEDYSIEVKTISPIKNTYKSFILCRLKSQCKDFQYKIIV